MHNIFPHIMLTSNKNTLVYMLGDSSLFSAINIRLPLNFTVVLKQHTTITVFTHSAMRPVLVIPSTTNLQSSVTITLIYWGCWSLVLPLDREKAPSLTLAAVSSILSTGITLQPKECHNKNSLQKMNFVISGHQLPHTEAWGERFIECSVAWVAA